MHNTCLFKKFFVPLQPNKIMLPFVSEGYRLKF